VVRLMRSVSTGVHSTPATPEMERVLGVDGFQPRMGRLLSARHDNAGFRSSQPHSVPYKGRLRWGWHSSLTGLRAFASQGSRHCRGGLKATVP
jgi:hypothetical protein